MRLFSRFPLFRKLCAAKAKYHLLGLDLKESQKPSRTYATLNCTCTYIFFKNKQYICDCTSALTIIFPFWHLLGVESCKFPSGDQSSTSSDSSAILTYLYSRVLSVGISTSAAQILFSFHSSRFAFSMLQFPTQSASPTSARTSPKLIFFCSHSVQVHGLPPQHGYYHMCLPVPVSKKKTLGSIVIPDLYYKCGIDQVGVRDDTCASSLDSLTPNQARSSLSTPRL